MTQDASERIPAEGEAVPIYEETEAAPASGADFVIREVKREPVGLAGFDNCYIGTLRLTERFDWSVAYKKVVEKADESELEEEKHYTLAIPTTLHFSIVDNEGVRIKNVDEWDRWSGVNYEASQWLFSRCMESIGTLEAAKKK